MTGISTARPQPDHGKKEIRLAIASSDGISVNEHFGRARAFRIFRFNAGGWEYLETREAAPACGSEGHNDDELEKTAGIIGDCWGVAIAQIGPAAFDLLRYNRILPFVLNCPVDDALHAITQSKQFKRLVQN